MSSRFCILAVDVEPGTSAVKKKKKPTKPKQPREEEEKIKNNINHEKNKNNKLNSKKKKNVQEERQLKAMAFGMGSSKTKKKVVKEGATKPAGNKREPNKKESSKVNGETGDNIDEDWQRRDEEYVRDENERSLREAMMLSKLEYEEKKTKNEEEVKGAKVKKKKEKPVTMSLEQFNSMRIDKMSKKGEQNGQDPPRPKNGNKFFDDIDETARKTAERETKKEQYKASAGQFNQAMLISEYESQIEKRDFEIQALRLEVESLKNDLQLVKSRNKKLCEVICAAEMKAKAELVVELDKMTKVREELTQEVARLSGQLEQERSKVTQLSGDGKKQGKKK